MNIKLLRLVPQILAVVLTMFGMAACSATASAPTDTSTKASEPQSEELNPNNADGYVERVISAMKREKKRMLFLIFLRRLS